jgi:fatty acid/phospholipid biosynthesis enzyme
MIGALISGSVIKNIKKALDYESKGGAMFLGLSKTVVKGHCTSKARGFAVCIEQAANAVRGDMVNKMKVMIDKVNEAEAAKAQQSAAQANE